MTAAVGDLVIITGGPWGCLSNDFIHAGRVGRISEDRGPCGNDRRWLVHLPATGKIRPIDLELFGCEFKALPYICPYCRFEPVWRSPDSLAYGNCRRFWPSPQGMRLIRIMHTNPMYPFFWTPAYFTITNCPGWEPKEAYHAPAPEEAQP